MSLIRRLHFYAGILVAPFLIVATISGGLYAIAPTLEQLVYRDQLHTSSTGEPAAVADQVRAATALRPDLQLSAVRPAAESGDTTRVLFTDPTLGESERLAVFIDPVTLESTGALVSYGSSAALPIRTWISQLHRHLHLGEPGRLYSELAASWLWVIALGGLALWITRHRQRRRAGRAARLLTPDRSVTGRSRNLSWHGAIGVWVVVGLVFLSATGLTWSRYAGENVAELRTALSWTTPEMSTSLSGADTGSSAHADHGGHSESSTEIPSDTPISTLTQLDSTLAVAAAQGVDEAVEATIPSAPGTAISVTETRQPWQLSPDAIAIDPTTGRIVDESRFGDWPLAAQLTTWGIALHMGILFGLLNQIVLLALAIVLLILIVRGYLMWWQRRPRRAGTVGVGRPPARGTLRRLPVPTLVAVVVAAVAVGWFIPLLGISLLAFLAIDVASGQIGRLRAQADGRRNSTVRVPSEETTTSTPTR